MRAPPEPLRRSNCRPLSTSTIGRLRCGELSVPAGVAQRVLGEFPGDVGTEEIARRLRCPEPDLRHGIQPPAADVGPGRRVGQRDARCRVGTPQPPQPHAPCYRHSRSRRAREIDQLAVEAGLQLRPVPGRPQRRGAQARQLDVGPLVDRHVVVARGSGSPSISARRFQMSSRWHDRDAARQERRAGGLSVPWVKSSKYSVSLTFSMLVSMRVFQPSW